MAAAHETAQTIEARSVGGNHEAVPLVLFVGGDDSWYQQIERDLRCLQPNWLWRHIETGTEALATLSSVGTGAVVMDASMPEAREFAGSIEKLFPDILRVVRCNLRDHDTLTRWKDLRATMVAQEEGADTLTGTLDRALRLHGWMADPAITRLMPLLRKLHTAPRLYAQVTEELRSPNGSIEDVARLISADPVMSAKLLQVVNSAFFGLGHTICEPGEAVMFLGTERTRSLVLLAGIFLQFDGRSFLPLEDLWSHNLQVGAFARTLALAETKDGKVAGLAYTAGLLHDIGKIILAGNVPDLYRSVCRMQEEKKLSSVNAEQEVLGTTHAEVGACLLGTWGLPLPMLEAIYWHHYPERSPDSNFSLLTAVHAADVLAQESGCGSGGSNADEGMNVEYLTKLGLADRRNLWRKLCGIPDQPGDDPLEERVRRRREARENSSPYPRPAKP